MDDREEEMWFDAFPCIIFDFFSGILFLFLSLDDPHALPLSWDGQLAHYLYYLSPIPLPSLALDFLLDLHRLLNSTKLEKRNDSSVKCLLKLESL